MPSIGINRIGIGGRGGMSPSAYWAEHFTGIPELYANNPILLSEGLLRSVVLIDDVYHMFYERGKGSSGWTIYKKTSKDGLVFDGLIDELFPLGDAGTYDELGQADPTVLYEGPGDWKMWAEGKANGTIYNEWDKIFYAQSTDGNIWTKTGIAIQRGESGSWDDGYIHHPCVVKHNSVYYMFYTGAKSSSSNKKIGLATSSDGNTWTKYINNPVLDNGVFPEGDSGLLRPTNPILIYGTWYMWYWGSNGTLNRLHLATSKDLIAWEKAGQVLTNIDHTASANLLVQGTSWRDKIVQHWFSESATARPCFSTIALANDKTMLSGFTRNQKFGDGWTINHGLIQPGYIYLNQIVVSGIRQHIKSISVFVGGNKPTMGMVKLALYNEVSGTASALLGTTEERNWSDIVSNAWAEFELLSELELIDGNYWVGIQTEQTFYKPKKAGGLNNWGYATRVYGNFPEIISGSTNQAYAGIGVFVIGDGNNTNTISLATEPNNIYFNTIKGNKKESIAEVDSEFDWYWDNGLLYVFSISLVDVRYQISYD